MANGYTGVPEVQPETRAPNAYQDIRADASSFGADIGKGLQEAGAQASKTGQMFAQVAADDASNQLTERWTKRLYGDSNATVPGPDGKPMADTGYMGLKGRAALDARPELEKAMDADLNEIKGGLTTLEMQKSFENFSRRYRSHVVERVGSHAEGQANVWYGHVNQASEKLALEHISIHADDPEEVKHGTSDLLAARVKQAQLAGGGDELLTQARKSAQADSLKARVEAIAVKDPVRALDLLEQNREIAGTAYVPLASHLRARAAQVNGQQDADEVLNRTPAQSGRSQTIMEKAQANGYSPFAGAAIAGHIYHESGNDPNAVHDGGVGLGIAGWNGERLDQLKRFAAARGKSQNDFATQADFIFHEMENGDAGARRAGEELKNAKTLEEATAAFMHFERPRGYTPDNPRNGDSFAARYANAAKFAGGNFSVLPDKTTAFERIVERTHDDPQRQAAALSWMNHVYTIYNAEARQASAAFKTQVQDSMAEAMRTGSVQHPLTEVDFVNNFGVGDGPRAFGEYQAQVKLGADMASVATMLPEEQDELLKRYEPKPGEGFLSAAKRQDALAKVIQQVRDARAKDPDFKARIDGSMIEAARTGRAANPVSIAEFQARLGADAGTAAYNQYRASLRLGRDAQTITDLSAEEQNALLRSYEPEGADDLGGQAKRQQELRKAVEAVRKERDADPAAYALTRLPAVRAAQGAMGQTLANPQATPEERQAARRQYANVTLGEQARVGIPPEDRAILTKDEVNAFTTALSRAVDADDPQQRIGLVGQITQEAKSWGDAWPAVMRQLTPEAQPIVRAIAAGADPTAMTRLLALPKEEAKRPSTIVAQQNETKWKDFTPALNTEMAPFLRTLIGPQKDRDYGAYLGLAKELGALYVRDGEEAKPAAEKAFNALIGNRYDFRDTWRMPKNVGVAVNDVQAGTVAASRIIAQSATEAGGNPFGIVPFRNDIGLTDNRADSLSKFARDGRFVTSWDNTGLNLVYDTERRGPVNVKTAAGKDFFLSWADLARLGSSPEVRAAAMKTATEFAPGQTP